MNQIIGITGASGYVGRHVAARLAEQGVPLRLVVRDPQRAPQLPNTEVAQASDYTDTAAMTAGLRGVQTLFLISIHLTPDRGAVHSMAVDAALAAGVQRIVYLSFLNAAPNATFSAAREHYQTEAHIRAAGVPFTFLRSSLYADEAPTWFDANGILRGPAGDGKVSWVMRDDIVESAAAVLIDPAHNGHIYNNTGPEALTLDETAALISEISGRRCVYHRETLEEAKASRAPSGAPPNVIEAWVSSYLAIATGEMSLITNDIQRVTGHPAHTLRDYLLKYPLSYAHLSK